LTKEIKLPGETKGLLKGIRDKKNLEKFKADLKEQGITDEKTVEDLIKNRAKLSLDVVKPTSSGRELDPDALTKPGTSLKEFEKAKRIFEGKFRYDTGGKIPKYQVP
jgi:hypothetical protein